MRLIVMGVNNPSPENARKIDQVLAHIPHCPACGRAFLEEIDDDDSSGAKTKAEGRKTKK